MTGMTLNNNSCCTIFLLGNTYFTHLQVLLPSVGFVGDFNGEALVFTFSAVCSFYEKRMFKFLTEML